MSHITKGTAMAYATTIRFSRPIRGDTIIRLVEVAVTYSKASYTGRCYVQATDPTHPGKIFVGQASDQGCDHLQIHPQTDLDHGLDPSASYRQIAVISRIWPNWGHKITGNKEGLQVLAEFSDHLEALLAE